MKYFDNHFLFSETFIKAYLREENKKKNQESNDVGNVFKLIREWNNEFVSGDYKNDPWSNYIDSILDVLGFQKSIQNGNRLLYVNTINVNEKPVAVCHFINKNESVASTKKGIYYAYNALEAAKEYGVNWAILTNGYQWRIYHTKNISPYENYLEVDIEESIQNNTTINDAFKLFYLFFNVSAYYTKDGELEIDKIRYLSDAKAETIEDTLRNKAEEILKELCYGLKENMGKDNYTEEEKKGIYNDAIILLYRLLFFGYAESRDLLPIIENDPDYIESFKRICKDAKNLHNAGEVYQIKDGYEFWQRIDLHLRIYVDRSYNGGLFHNSDKPILKDHRIANGRLTKCLAELAYNSDKNGKYSEAIEYKDLSVRNMGSIYEGLLEYRLFIADERMVQKKSKGQVKYLRAADIKLQNSDLKNIIEKGGIYLSQDAVERKETGSYYTPEDVVEYIVENTVGKKLTELKVELQNRKKPFIEQWSYEPLPSRQRMLQNQIDQVTMDFINEKILSLSIIDSAMGSGHFLVNATYRVANEIVGIIAENAWESDRGIFADIKYWKREVVENCIYGIDINGLAVALARLSLWLISASNDKALSFIDHHLKEGNSIIGTDRRHVEIKGSKKNLFGALSYEDYMKPILNKYIELKKMGSATKADVARQQDIYDEINEELKIAKKKYDYYLASQFAGGIKDQIGYYNLLASKEIRDFKKKGMESLWALAKEKKFFHWELEFSEVFQKGGFDIVIGNPPYFDVPSVNYINTIIRYPETNNLYSYILDTALQFTNEKSFTLALIIPLSIVCADRMESLRNSINNTINAEISYLNIDSSSHPGCLFKNVIARLTILVINKSSIMKEKVIKSTDYIKFFSRDRANLFDKVDFVELQEDLLIGNLVPKIGHRIERKILDKVLNKTTKSIKDFCSLTKTENYFYYRRLGINYYATAFEEPPLFIVNDEEKISSTLSKMYLKDSVSKYIPICLLYSSLFYWFWTVYSNCYDLKTNDIYRLPIDLGDEIFNKQTFCNLYQEINTSLHQNGKIVVYNKKNGITKYFEYKPRYSKQIFDKVDVVLANYYGLTDEESTFIKRYDIRFRINEEGVEHEL